MSTVLSLTLPKPHANQWRVLSTARRFNVAVCGRRWGKSILGENRLADASLLGKPVAYFAPSYRMMAEVWRDMVRLLRPVTKQVYVQDRRIDLITGGVVEFWSLDTPDVARGRKYGRVVIDEAAMIPHLEEAWQAVIRPTLADYAGDAWFLSTPRGFNFFHTLYQRGKSEDHPDYASWQMPSSANPYLPPGEIESARAETPDTVFQQEWLGQFTDDASTIYSPTWWQNGRNRYDPAEAVPPNLYAGRWLSWDTAFKDTATAAYSACVVGELVDAIHPGRQYQMQIRDVYRDRLPFPALIDESTRLIQRWDADNKLRAILVEDAASGQSLVQTLRLAMPAYGDAIVPVPVGLKGKAERASRISVWCREGGVLLPRPGPDVPWLKAFEEELYAAPFGQFMDQADAFAQLVHWNEPYISEGIKMRGRAIAA